MNSITVTYEEVRWPVTKTVACARCGRGRKIRRSTTFTQTLNPFNKIKEGPRAGEVKTRADILPELRAKAEAWHPVAEHPAGRCPAGAAPEVMKCENCEREIAPGGTFARMPGSGGLVVCGEHADEHDELQVRPAEIEEKR